GRLDVLVNNAGTAIPKPFEETTLEELDRLIDINIRGTFVATQSALKHMNDSGRIINIGSCVGERAMTPGLAPDSATTGAIKMFTQGLSREVGSRSITALNRFGHVEDVAALVASPKASYITGANLTGLLGHGPIARGRIQVPCRSDPAGYC